MKLCHFVQKMKKNTLKDGLDTKKDAKRDAKSIFCCSDGHPANQVTVGNMNYQPTPTGMSYTRIPYPRNSFTLWG